MSRTVINLVCDNPKESETVIQDVLKKNNYQLEQKDGEEYYKCGVGVVTAPKFISYSFDGNKLKLEGWIRPFAFGGESELNGFVAAVPKRSCRQVLEEIQNSLNASVVSNEVQVAEEKSHNLAMVLGFVFALLIPIIGLIFGIYLITRNDSESAKKYGMIIILLAVVIYGVSRLMLMG